MPSSLYETLYQIEDFKQQLAVWHDVTNHLARFLDTDVKEAQEGIAAPGCVRPELRVRGREVVPQDVVATIIQAIETEKIAPLIEEIHVLENLHVVETIDDKQVERVEGQAKKDKKRVRVVAQPVRG